MKLSVTPAQESARLVAPNAVTLAQAAYDPASQVFGIWDGDRPVGLIAYWDPVHAEADRDPEDDPEALFLWRLMINSADQRRGAGRAALEFLHTRARALGHPRVTLSCVHHDQGPAPFYRAFGFTPTGQIVGGEHVYAMETA